MMREAAELKYIRVNPSGSRNILFLFHAVSGGTSAYRNISPHIPNHTDIIALNARGRPGDMSSALDSVNKLAENYAKLIEEVSHERPIILLGWCFGGILALESAFLLRRRGIAPNWIGLVETNLMLTKPVERRDELRKMFWNSLANIVSVGKVGNIDEESNFWSLNRKSRLSFIHDLGRDFGNMSYKDVCSLINVFSANWKASQSYSPTHDNIDFHFFSADSSNIPGAVDRWKSAGHIPITETMVSADHFSILDSSFFLKEMVSSIFYTSPSAQI